MTNQILSTKRIILFAIAVMVLPPVALALLYGWFIGNTRQVAEAPVADTGSKTQVENSAASFPEQRARALEEKYATAVEVRDYSFVPNSITVKKGEEVAFYTLDPRVYEMSMKGNKLFTVRGAGRENKITTSTFIFNHKGSFIFEVSSPDNPSQKANLAINVES